MRLVLAEPKLLSESIAVISELVNEVVIKITSDSMEIVAIDPANVAMVNFKFLSSAFAEYNVSGEKDISINLDSLKPILRRAKPTDTIILSLDEENSKLKIDLRGENNRSFTCSLIDIEEKEQKLPKLDFPVVVEMPAEGFNEAIEDIGIISDSVNLTAEKNKIIVEGESSLSGVKIEIPSGESTNISLKSKGEKIVSKYSVEYLKKIIKGSKLSENVKIYFGNEYPLKTEYAITDKLYLSFILAPRMNND